MQKGNLLLSKKELFELSKIIKNVQKNYANIKLKALIENIKLHKTTVNEIKFVDYSL